jgi:diadenosine tetraphosphatase ApaH/serine/threonine PP2A family protein phosphatase
MTEHLSRRGMLVLLVAVAGLVTSGVGAAVGILRTIFNGPQNPDPDNRRLHMLAADPVFAGLPPGAIRTSWQENPAERRSGGLFAGGQGWDGPSVIATFTSSQSVRDVYRFYDERAHQADWTPWQKLENGSTRSWLKNIAGHRSFINLLPNDFDIHSVDVTESGTPRSYRLTGSA